MACLARNLALAAMFKVKSVSRQKGRSPGHERVAASAVETEPRGMDGRFFVAGSTLVRIRRFLSSHPQSCHIHHRRRLPGRIEAHCSRQLTYLGPGSALDQGHQHSDLIIV